MAKKLRAARSNKLGLKNKSKTQARRAAKVKDRPSSKAAAKSKPTAKGKRSSANKAAGFSRKFLKPVVAEVKKLIGKVVDPSAAAHEQEMENRRLFSLAKEATSGVPDIAAPNPKDPTEAIFHSKAKALRDANARQSQHAQDRKRGGFVARLPGAQKGRRGK